MQALAARRKASGSNHRGNNDHYHKPSKHHKAKNEEPESIDEDIPLRVKATKVCILSS